MCGIIGICGTSTVRERLVQGLLRLEYRGYDSAGIAVLDGGCLRRARAEGKIAALQDELEANPIDGESGIAHTRWATHGAPTTRNAHPHRAGRVAVVHNGIVENYLELKADMPDRTYTSDTDTEVVAHLIDAALEAGHSPREAFSSSLKKLRGAYALGVVVDGHAEEMFIARAGSPLAVGVGDGETYLGSDALALADLTRELVYLEEGDWAVLTPDGFEIFDRDDTPVTRPVTVLEGGAQSATKGGFDHYMLKEIHQQPDTLRRTLSHYLGVDAPEPHLDFSGITRVLMVACGTASYAADVAAYAFEREARLAAETDIASEFRYRDPVLDPATLFVAVSQSGETADTLAALRHAKAQGLRTLALVNVSTSTMAREADVALPILAGPEIGVASTKAFTSQVAALTSLAVLAGHQRGHLSDADAKARVNELNSLPALVEATLSAEPDLRALARAVSSASSAFFLGRGALAPVALEGALKLKEISYIHAEGYPAGELKHGPIALIESGTPVIVLAPSDVLFEKTVSNLQEVASRGAEVVLVTDRAGSEHSTGAAHTVVVPAAGDLAAPLVHAVAVQLLSYHAAVALGRDVDQPRNLAKSVTVE